MGLRSFEISDLEKVCTMSEICNISYQTSAKRSWLWSKYEHHGDIPFSQFFQRKYIWMNIKDSEHTMCNCVSCLSVSAELVRPSLNLETGALILMWNGVQLVWVLYRGSWPISSLPLALTPSLGLGLSSWPYFKLRLLFSFKEKPLPILVYKLRSA